jgi:hypothetical protein
MQSNSPPAPSLIGGRDRGGSWGCPRPPPKRAANVQTLLIDGVCDSVGQKKARSIRSNFRTSRALERFLEQPPQGGVPSRPRGGALG